MTDLFSPLLAGKAEPTDVRFPVLVSPRLDGVRVLVRGGRAVTQQGEDVANAYVRNWFQARPELEGLDGMVIVGAPTEALQRQRTTAAVMHPEGEPDFTFWVFDKFNTPGIFAERLGVAYEQVKRIGEPRVKVLAHHDVASLRELDQRERTFLERGFPGMVVRSLVGPYKCGRSTAEDGCALNVQVFGTPTAMLSMTAAEKNALLYAEHCLVEGGGLLAAERLRADGIAALGALQAMQVLDFGCIPYSLMEALRHPAERLTHWVTLKERGWAMAQFLRRARAEDSAVGNRQLVDASLALLGDRSNA